MGFLGFEGKKFLIVGVANKKSVACSIADIIHGEGGELIFSVEDEKKKQFVKNRFPESDAFICDVSDEKNIRDMAKEIGARHKVIHAIAHSVAYANYSDGVKPFHGVNKKDFMEAMDISCFSLVTISDAFKDILDDDGAVVTISISTVKMAAENYGYMAPVKAALDSAVVFLAKSFSVFSKVRFNAVAPGPLKTAASAGIPGYVDSYLFAEKSTLRNKGVQTIEAARVAVFLLSDASSGINAQKIVVDAGMEVNYFNKDAIRSSSDRI